MTSATLETSAERTQFLSRLGAMTNQHLLAGLVCLYILGALLLDPMGYVFVLGKKVMKVSHALAVPFVIYTIIVSYRVLSNKAPSLMAAHKAMNVRLFPAVWYFVLFITGLSAFTTFKLHIPDHMPFYLDQFFADLDKAMHGGVDPWIFTHAIPRFPGFDHIMNYVYGSIWFLQWFGTFITVALWRNTVERDRYMWAIAFTTLICGTILATALSSVGPIFYERFYDDLRFVELTDYLQATPGIIGVYATSNYLYDNYIQQVTVLGGGISAMPSVHVAIATLNAWFLSSFNRWSALAGWSFAAIIMFGSVYTGWHYAVDGYLSFIVVTAIWFAVSFVMKGRLAENRRRRAADKAAQLSVQTNT